MSLFITELKKIKRKKEKTTNQQTKKRGVALIRQIVIKGDKQY